MFNCILIYFYTTILIAAIFFFVYLFLKHDFDVFVQCFFLCLIVRMITLKISMAWQTRTMRKIYMVNSCTIANICLFHCLLQRPVQYVFHNSLNYISLIIFNQEFYFIILVKEIKNMKIKF